MLSIANTKHRIYELSKGLKKIIYYWLQKINKYSNNVHKNVCQLLFNSLYKLTKLNLKSNRNNLFFENRIILKFYPPKLIWCIQMGPLKSEFDINE